MAKITEEQRKKNKEWYSKNKDRVLKEAKEQYWSNPELERERARKRNKKRREIKKNKESEYYELHKDSIDEENRIKKEAKLAEKKRKEKEWGRLWRIKNADKLKEYRLKNKEKSAAVAKKYRKDNPDKFKIYAQKNKEKAKQRYKAQPEKNKERRRKNKERRKADDNLRMQDALSKRIRGLIKKRKGTKKVKTLELIGCTVYELRKHLESLFLPGMSWDNYGYYGWHIDHIIPCASFDLTKEEEQRKCFHYTNLQPLWAIDNMKKNAKLNYKL